MKLRVAKASDVKEGEPHSFRLVREGRFVNCFLIRFKGELLAYENKCRHIPISLDYDDARFLDKEGRYIVCQTHGAMYEPSTGECVEGPCSGETLFSVPLEITASGIFVESDEAV